MPAPKTTLVYEAPIRVIPKRDRLNAGSPTRTKADAIAARTDTTLMRQREHPSLRSQTPQSLYSIYHLTKWGEEILVGNYEDSLTSRPPTFSKALRTSKTFKQYLNRLYRENPDRIETIFFRKGHSKCPGFKISGSFVVTETGKRLILYRPAV